MRLFSKMLRGIRGPVSQQPSHVRGKTVDVRGLFFEQVLTLYRDLLGSAAKDTSSSHQIDAWLNACWREIGDGILGCVQPIANGDDQALRDYKFTVQQAALRMIDDLHGPIISGMAASEVDLANSRRGEFRRHTLSPEEMRSVRGRR
jgi:hypothetical protein